MHEAGLLHYREYSISSIYGGMQIRKGNTPILNVRLDGNNATIERLSEKADRWIAVITEVVSQYHHVVA